MEKKRLYKSKDERMICGVCGGIGDYLNVDPTIIRLIWVAVAAASCGMALLAYFVSAVIIPDEDQI